jgi:hypothetical protein
MRHSFRLDQYTSLQPGLKKNIPDIYRLVRFRTDEGQVHLKLQGYFTWYQGFKLFGGEWKDIETVDADDLSDDKPYGQLT